MQVTVYAIDDDGQERLVQRHANLADIVPACERVDARYNLERHGRYWVWSSPNNVSKLLLLA